MSGVARHHRAAFTLVELLVVNGYFHNLNADLSISIFRTFQSSGSGGAFPERVDE